METAFADLPAFVRRETSPQHTCDAREAGGIYDGTLIATVSGWRRVENLRLGDQLLSLDGGPVRLLGISQVPGLERPAHPEHWPRLIPAGVLGNRSSLRLRPGQGVLVESSLAEALCGDCFALLSVRALDGFRGIAPVPQLPLARVWRLELAEDQVLCAEGEALLFCPGQKSGRYQPLTGAQTVDLLRALDGVAA